MLQKLSVFSGFSVDDVPKAKEFHIASISVDLPRLVIAGR